VRGRGKGRGRGGSDADADDDDDDDDDATAENIAEDGDTNGTNGSVAGGSSEAGLEALYLATGKSTAADSTGGGGGGSGGDGSGGCDSVESKHVRGAGETGVGGAGVRGNGRMAVPVVSPVKAESLAIAPAWFVALDDDTQYDIKQVRATRVC